MKNQIRDLKVSRLIPCPTLSFKLKSFFKSLITMRLLQDTKLGGFISSKTNAIRDLRAFFDVCLRWSTVFDVPSLKGPYLGAASFNSPIFKDLPSKEGFILHRENFESTLSQIDDHCNLAFNLVKSHSVYEHNQKVFSLESQYPILEDAFPIFKSMPESKKALFNPLIKRIDELILRPLNESPFGHSEVALAEELLKNNFVPVRCEAVSFSTVFYEDHFLRLAAFENQNEVLLDIFNMSAFAPSFVGFVLSHKIICSIGVGTGLNLLSNTLIHGSFHAFLERNLLAANILFVTKIPPVPLANTFLREPFPVVLTGVLVLGGFSGLFYLLQEQPVFLDSLKSSVQYGPTDLSLRLRPVQDVVVRDVYHFSDFISRIATAASDGLGGLRVRSFFFSELQEMLKQIKNIF